MHMISMCYTAADSNLTHTFPRRPSLSKREMQVLMMIVQGAKNQDISDTLCVSPKTISTYRHRLFDKLGIQTDAELTILAIRHGIAEYEV